MMMRWFKFNYFGEKDDTDKRGVFLQRMGEEDRKWRRTTHRTGISSR